MSIFSSLIDFIKLFADYLMTIVSSVIQYFGLIMSSSVVFAEMVGYLPSIIQISGMAVISIAIFKAIFGRQGSS